jgi:hypothetical protein
MNTKIIKFIEVNDYQFKVLIDVEGHSLETQPIAKSSTEEEMTASIKERVERFVSDQAVENFEELKKLEGTVICI